MHARTTGASCLSVPLIFSARSIYSLAILACAGVAFFAPATTFAWEAVDLAEVFTTTSHLQEMSCSTDGAGGALAVTIDQDIVPDRIVVTRLSHTGDEVWGDNGKYLPITIGDQWNSWPVAVTHDGAGGGYFAYRAGRTGFDMLRLAHSTADGAVSWSIDVDNLGAIVSGDTPKVQLTPTLNGEVILTWIRFQPSLQLYAARVDRDHTILWHGPVVGSAWPAGYGWIAEPDAQGGVLVAYTKSSGEARVQRLAAGNGARLWGSDGAFVWLLQGAAEDVLADGSGGAFVVRSLTGIAYAQHLDASGNKTWGSDTLVQASQTPWYALSTGPQLCSDGAGGFLMVHGLENVFAQRVDPAGNTLWGSGVTISTLTDIGRYPKIHADGLGGGLVVFHDHWEINPGGPDCRQVNTVRVDTFGTVLWHDYTALCSFSWGPGGTAIVHNQPEKGVPLGDGSGGAMTFWLEEDSGSGNHERALARGCDANGEVPAPRLAFLFPDAAEPDQSGPYTVLGDYIDLDMGYTLLEEDGTHTHVLTPTDQPNALMVSGTTTLTGLKVGGYHLVVDQGGIPADTLQHAVGIGPPMPCEGDAPLLEDFRSVDLSGSPRQSTFDPEGRLHVVWTEYHSSSNEYHLHLQTRDGGWGAPEPLAISRNPLKSPTLACDGEGRLHLIVLEELSSTSDRVLYLRASPEGIVEVTDVYEDGNEHAHPVITLAGESAPHFVLETGSGGSQILEHRSWRGSFSSPLTVATGLEPREPDLVGIGDELEVIFVRNSVIPGIQQVERAHHSGESWDAPELLSFALQVSSPSVSFDGGERILYAFLLDNEAVNGIPPLTHTMLRTAGSLGPLRARPGLPRHHSVQVSAAGPRTFAMMTVESEGGPVMSVFVRQTDGNVVFPRQQANSGTDVGDAHLAAHFGGVRTFAHWHDYGSGLAVFGQFCERAIGTATEPATPIVLTDGLKATPNPFNPATLLEFGLVHDSSVRLTVYDARGRRVRELLRGPLVAGPQYVLWNGRDDEGRSVASGVYLVRLDRGGGDVAVTKVALIE